MALFNNPYQQYFQPAYPSPNYFPQQSNQFNGKIYVQGEAAAKSYLVAPNASVVLWDSERPVVYEKSADINGVPTMRLYRLVEEGAEMAQNGVSEQKVEYITREEINAIYGQINDIRAEIDGLSIRRPSKKKEAADDE